MEIQDRVNLITPLQGVYVVCFTEPRVSPWATTVSPFGAIKTSASLRLTRMRECGIAGPTSRA